MLGIMHSARGSIGALVTSVREGHPVHARLSNTSVAQNTGRWVCGLAQSQDILPEFGQPRVTAL